MLSLGKQVEAQKAMPSVSSHRKRLFTRDIVELDFDDEEYPYVDPMPIPCGIPPPIVNTKVVQQL